MQSNGEDSAVQSGEYSPLHGSFSQNLTSFVLCATLTACLGALSFGYVLGYPSPVESDLQDSLKWSDDQVTWFSVSCSL